MSFDQLLLGLKGALHAGLVSRRFDPETGRSIWCYTNRCVYDNAWDDYTLIARGLILDEAASTVVATPFPKFCNAGERGRPIPDLPLETSKNSTDRWQSFIITRANGGLRPKARSIAHSRGGPKKDSAFLILRH
jgi:RNA ligase